MHFALPVSMNGSTDSKHAQWTGDQYQQPNSSLSHLISHLASKFFRILGTGFSSAIDIDRLSTGHVCCLFSHSWIQAAQNACSHSGANRGSSSTAEQIGHINSSSTSPWNLPVSYPIAPQRNILKSLVYQVSCRSESSNKSLV